MASKNHSHTNLASTFTLVSWAEKFTFGPKTFKQHWGEYSLNLSHDDSPTSRISPQNSVLELLINWEYQKKQLLNCIVWDKNQQTYIFVSAFMWHPVSQTPLCQNSPSQWFFTVVYSLLPFETGLIKKKRSVKISLFLKLNSAERLYSTLYCQKWLQWNVNVVFLPSRAQEPNFPLASKLCKDITFSQLQI